MLAFLRKNYRIWIMLPISLVREYILEKFIDSKFTRSNKNVIISSQLAVTQSCITMCKFKFVYLEEKIT